MLSTAHPHHPHPTDTHGRCTLVGAGPGDPELLTLKAVRAIESATVLLVDDLVSEAIIALAPRSARVVRVGKRGGCKSTPQAFIETLMLMAVHEGEHVVRLKGGDPFIFGRGGEEAEHLRAAGAAVEVVNGITAGLAGPTALGVPLTHRPGRAAARAQRRHARGRDPARQPAPATPCHGHAGPTGRHHCARRAGQPERHRCG